MKDIQQFYCTFAYIKILYSNASKCVCFVVIYDKSDIIIKEEIFEAHLNIEGKTKKKLFRKYNGRSVFLIYGRTWKDNTNEIWAFIHSFGADEEHLSTFGCHWDDLLLGLT
jgi:hypothetical protein